MARFSGFVGNTYDGTNCRPRDQATCLTTPGGMGEASMSKAIAKEDMALLKEASEMFSETGCVPGIDGEQVPAERIVPDAKDYISETLDDPETLYDPEIWDTP